MNIMIKLLNMQSCKTDDKFFVILLFLQILIFSPFLIFEM